MTQKHTPGPWRVIVHDRANKPDHFGRTTKTRVTFINGADGLGSIAKLYIGHDQDAHLIAAAPELLAALKAIVDGRPTEEPPLIATIAHQNWKLFEQARAAIEAALAGKETT